MQCWFFLQEGGEFYFSDVYADQDLPHSIRKHKVLWGKKYEYVSQSLRAVPCKWFSIGIDTHREWACSLYIHFSDWRSFFFFFNYYLLLLLLFFFFEEDNHQGSITVGVNNTYCVELCIGILIRYGSYHRYFEPIHNIYCDILGSTTVGVNNTCGETCFFCFNFFAWCPEVLKLYS